ncbi:MAG: hypothetical protein ACK4GL_08950 [Flavobacteriales bacterium]
MIANYRNIIIFLMCASQWTQGQNLISFSAGRSFGSFETFNQSIRTFNTARPWLQEQLPTINGGLYLDLTPSIRLSDKWKLSIPLNYRRMSSFASNTSFETYVLMQHMQAHAMLEFYPALAPDSLDPLSPKLFFAFGPGGSFLLPQVYFNNDEAQVFDDDYRSLNYHFSARLMIGLTIPLSDRMDISPFMTADAIPNFDARDFDVALHGKRLESSSLFPAVIFNAGIRIQFRMYPKDPEANNLSVPVY